MVQTLFLILLGFVLTAFLGLAASWVDRKVTARVQYRVGPPFLQPFFDIVKLTGKETLVPAGASPVVFLAAPVFGFAGAGVVSVLLWGVHLFPQAGFLGDWVVLVYLLMIPSLAIIVGGFASSNPLASLGASREMQLMMAYELPFVVAALVPVIQAGYSLRLADILRFQSEQGAVAWSVSGFLALVVAVICMQAKLAVVPFDNPDAETEICGGPLIEYSGSPLGLFRLTKNMLLFVLPFALVTLYLGGFSYQGWELLWSVLKYVALLALVTVIRNTNPRVRIDQVVRFFWGPLTILSLAALALAVFGF